jgi:hypothetical protein
MAERFCRNRTRLLPSKNVLRIPVPLDQTERFAVSVN